MFQKARDASVPIDTIERAIKRGTGELEGVTYESITYEGYAPGGVAVLVDVLTDNRNRTGAEVRSVFTKNGGSMAEPGAVAWQFERKGVDPGRPARVDEDELMLAALDAGAEDIVDDGDAWRVTTTPTDARTPCATRSSEAGIAGRRRPSSTMVPRRPSCRSTTAEAAKKVLRLIDALEDHDDVQDVYANFDIPDSVMDLLEEADGLSEGVFDRANQQARSSAHWCTVRRSAATQAVLAARSLALARSQGAPVSVGVGDRAPAFTLEGTDARRSEPARRKYSLSDFAGRPVVLVFYPGDDTPVCTKQLNDYNDDIERVRGARRPGAGHLARSRRQPRALRRPSTGSRSRCWPTPTRRSPASTARSGRSASPAAACSSSTATAWSATPTGRIAGLTFRPVGELVAALKALPPLIHGLAPPLGVGRS